MTTKIVGFTEEERKKGLRSKISTFMDNGMTTYDLSTNEKKRELQQYFTDKELQIMIAKLVNCGIETQQVVSNVGCFNCNAPAPRKIKPEMIDLSNEQYINRLYSHFQNYKGKYWNGENLDTFFCGFFGKMRQTRKNTISKVTKKLYDNSIPKELLRYTNEYLDTNDKLVEPKKISGNVGGRKRRKQKTKRRKYKR